jgi:hypothetical protein
VAVKVTALAAGAGFREELIVLVLGRKAIICESTLEVLLLNVASPPYTAVMEWGEPLTESALVVKLATPEGFKVPPPRLLVPS